MPRRSPILPTRELALGGLLAAQAAEQYPEWGLPREIRDQARRELG